MAKPPLPHSPGTPGDRNGAPEAPASASQGIRRLIWGLVIAALMMVISLPTVLLVFFGMLPTVVAWIVDRNKGKYATFCVGGINFSGVFPFLTDVWFKNHSTDAALAILTNAVDLMIMYGAAAFGSMLYFALPPVITTFLSAMSQRRVEVLRETQATIIEEWGESVAKAVELVGAPRPKA